MEICNSIKELRTKLSSFRYKGERIGFVPTLGWFHDGHLTLMRRARADCDIVVVSIYLNPIQFPDKSDYETYPKDLERDSELARDAGVDFLFTPPDKEIYPTPQEVFVDAPNLSNKLEGAVRPGHFQGSATVVTKLLNIIQPNYAYFGEKDYQQLLIFKKMVKQLNIPVKIIEVETVRHRNGLSLSSRNERLTPEQLESAVRIYQSISEVKRLVENGEREVTNIIQEAMRFLQSDQNLNPEIVAVCNPNTLEDLKGRLVESFLLLLYVRIGDNQLFDHAVIRLS